MPELAEVEFSRQQWNPGLRQKIISIHLHSQKRVFRGTSTALLARTIQGRHLRSSHAHGKQMLFRFGSDAWLGLHLGMTGRLSTATTSHSPRSHDHLVLRTARHSLIFQDPRLFGRVRFALSPQPPSWWSNLPPPLHSPKFSKQKLQKICSRRSRAPLKALLLMQQFFPGIGNWMADEILWQTQLSPRTQAGLLSQKSISNLHASIRKICRDALRTIGRGKSNPPRSWLFRHRWKAGRHCPRCHHSLQRAPIGGRTTCWCPICPPPTPRPRATRR